MRVEVGDEAKKWCAPVAGIALHGLISMRCSALHHWEPQMQGSFGCSGPVRVSRARWPVNSVPLAGQSTALRRSTRATTSQNRTLSMLLGCGEELV